LVTAHWETRSFSVSANINKTTIYDFHGFSEKLYEYEYPSPAAIGLAEELQESLRLVMNRDRGLDHGAWVPLVAMYPQHNIPVVLLSVAPGQGAKAHFELGQKLAALRDRNILVITSGAIIHNLGQLKWNDPSAAPDVWATDFVEEIQTAVEKQDWEFLIQTESIRNYRIAHPSDEHYLPLLVAAGASGDDDVSVFSDVWSYGNLAMQGLRFG
jgi:4,5-DOPA dioxygenase extradiol